MGGTSYLEGLPPAQAERLARVNDPGLTALRGYLADGEAVAFLGAGVSRPLYPLWSELIGELVASASGRLTDEEAATCLILAHCAGLAARARIRASQATTAADPDRVYQGRDAADAALRRARAE